MQFLHAAAQCGGGPGQWPAREGEVWWSICPSAPTCMQPRVPGPITDEQLQDWVQDTVGWAALEISAEAFMAAGSHPSQVKPLVQAAFEAAARLNTRKCRFKQVDIDSQLAKCVTVALLAYPNFKSLVLQELNVYDEAVTQLAHGLSASENLVKLVLSTCDLSSAGWDAVTHAVATSASIRQLKIRGGVSRIALGSICTALKHCRALQVLDLSGNALGDGNVGRLCDALAANSSIKILKLDRVGMTAQGAASLSRCVQDSKQLTCLHLGHNDIGPQGCADLAKALAGSTTLQQLWAPHTGWDDMAVQHLAASLTTCLCLNTIDLSYCRITDRGSHILSAAAMKLPLAVIKLSGNTNMGTPGLETWCEVLSMPKRPLTLLALSDCEAGDPAAFSLAAVVRATASTGTLEQLEVASNHFTHKGVGALMNAAACSHTLRCLDVSLNWLGPRAMTSCLKAMEDARAASAQAAAARTAKDADKLTPGLHLLMPVHPCEIKSEVLQEFRDIERVKFGDWTKLEQASQRHALQLQHQQQQQQEQEQPTKQDNSNPFVDAPPAQNSPGVDVRGVEEEEEMRHGSLDLRPGHPLPVALGRTSSEGSQYCSTRTRASSRTDDAGRGLSDGTDSSSSSPRHGGAGKQERLLEPDLQGMSDGTINCQLPVSFSPQEAPNSDLPSQPVWRNGLRNRPSLSGTGASAALQPSPSFGGSPTEDGNNQEAMSRHTSLTPHTLNQLNQQLGPLRPGELLVMASRRHGVTQAVGAPVRAGAGPGNPLASPHVDCPARPPAAQHMSAHTAAPTVPAMHAPGPLERGAVEGLAGGITHRPSGPDTSNPFDSPSARASFEQAATQPQPVSEQHLSRVSQLKEDRNPFLSPAVSVDTRNPFASPGSISSQQENTNPFLSPANSQQVNPKAQSDNPFL